MGKRGGAGEGKGGGGSIHCWLDCLLDCSLDCWLDCLLDCWLAGAQVWNERHAQEEVLGMVVRTGLYITMGTMLRQVMAPLNAVEHLKDPAIVVSPSVCATIFGL